MGGFLSFVKKEALHILRDKRTMLIVLLLPIVQILLFGFAISTEMNNIDFAVVAPNRTETIRDSDGFFIHRYQMMVTFGQCFA